MRKTRLLLASLLKPVNDTRMYEKMALTLQLLPGADVHVCGFQAPLPGSPTPVHLHPIFNFKRLSFSRILAQVKFFKLLLRVKPHLLILNTHELLLTGVLYKIFSGCKLVYDVQENYYLNLTRQNIFPSVIKQLLGFTVRANEWLSSPFIAHFILAEKCYAHELPFLQNRYTVIENKYKPARQHQPEPKPFPIQISEKRIKLLFSGTISELNGTFEAIQFCQALQQLQPSVELTIIGYAAQPEVYEKLKQQIKDKPYIRLIGGNELVPHEQILKEISNSDVGLLPYRPNPSTYHCTPTKLFEYLGNGLPVIVQNNPNWQSIVQEHRAGFSINFQDFDAKTVLSEILNGRFYPTGIPAGVFWETEGEKLLQVISKLLAK
ncbi:MAG: glycosyltransferase [Hymenobacteraceae bacterium]|nr:glycosyltransferase [Hymenobacteraceae bacterium]